MRSKRPTLALFDIRDHARLAQEFAAGLTLETFAADRRTFYAVTRCLEIVSEASRRLPTSVRDRHPELPWRAIMDVGNVYRHAYDNVSEEAVWRAVQHRLAPLLAAVESEIARLPDESSAAEQPDTEPTHDEEPRHRAVTVSGRVALREPKASKQG